MEERCAIDGCMIEIMTVYPADVVERKRGEWEHISETMRCCCSQCKYERNVATQFGWNFCPNCGADMREG